MKILESFQDMDLIEIVEGEYCVRQKTKGFFGGFKDKYYATGLNGTEFLLESLNHGGAETITDDLKRAQYIFNCNKIRQGGL